MGWIGGRTFDLAFFFGGAALSVLVGALLVFVPSLTVPVFLAWLLLLDGPHVVLTWTRTYLDPDEWRKRRGVLLLGLAFVLPGLLAWGLSWGAGARGAWDLFLLVATLWSFHHNVRQNYGILMIYERLANAPRETIRFDGWFQYVAQWLAFALFIVGFSANRLEIGLPETLDGPLRAVVLAMSALLATLVAGYAIVLVRRARRGASIRPGLFTLVVAVGTAAFAFFVVGPFEPLAAGSHTIEQLFLATQIVGGLPHGMQYVGIIAVANRRRFARAEDTRLVARIGRAPLVAYGLSVLVSVAYLALNFARGAVPGGSFHEESTAAGQLFLALYWGFFFHHYYLDQKIWRVASDPRLRRELGLGGAT